MQDFVFHTPTEIVFGKNAEVKTGELVRKYGGTRVFVVYGGGSVVRSGLLARVTAQLDDCGVAHMTYGGVKPNPLVSHARTGVAAAIEFGADFILAVGGGSAIDAAKAIAHGVANPNTDIWEFWTHDATLTSSLPVGVVLTISAAGSETSNSAVLTNGDTGEKRGLGNDLNKPRFAVMNPELTYTLPTFQTACGVVDIMMHTLDRYFSPQASNELTDGIASAVLRTVIKNGSVAVHNPSDYDAASEIMWCGSLSHNGITGLGRLADFSVHQLGHELGGRFDVAHGASLSAMWGSWAEYCMSTDIERFAKYARDIWAVGHVDDTLAATEGIARTVVYFASLGMPTCFTELGVGIQDETAIDELADGCVFHGKRTIGTFRTLDKEDVAAIYRMANR